MASRNAEGAVAFTVVPATVGNTYAGTVTLQVTGLTAGASVLIQKYFDANGDGAIDIGDPLVQQFNLTDGQATVIGGVTNIHVPSDMDSDAGQITTALIFDNGDLSQNIIGSYAYVLSSPGGAFAAITNFLSVTNSDYGQTLRGSVVSNGTNVPNAVVTAYFAETAGVSTLADSSGHYTIAVAPGSYVLIASKSNYVSDVSTEAPISVGAGAMITTNVGLIPGSESIAGRITDAANTNAGLPGLLLFLESSSGQSTIARTDASGNFSAQVIPDSWTIILNTPELNFSGYLGLQRNPQIDASAGSVTGASIALPRATALFYGTVEDANNDPLPGVELYGYNGDGPYQGEGTTDQNGYYVVAVNQGVWHAHVDFVSPGYEDYIFSAGLADTNVVDGEAISQNLLGLLATNQITGYILDGNSVAVGGVGVAGSAEIDGYGFAAPSVLTDADGYYSLMVANGSWDVSVDCSIGAGSLNALGYACVDDDYVDIGSDNGVADFAPIPFPSLTALSWSLGRFQLRLANAVAGQDYTIQMSTNLNSGDWISLFTTNNLTTNSYTIVDSSATNLQRFYRALILR